MDPEPRSAHRSQRVKVEGVGWKWNKCTDLRYTPLTASLAWHVAVTEDRDGANSLRILSQSQSQSALISAGSHESRVMGK